MSGKNKYREKQCSTLRKACNQKFLKEIIEILFISLDTKVPKNQGKKNAARSAASAF